MAALFKQSLRHVAPARRSYQPAEPTPIEALPFVVREADTWHYWRVHTTGDYGLDCDLGREYAAHYLQWIKDNPGYASENSLAMIARDVNYKSARNHGFWLAFFYFLEQQLGERARQINPFEISDAQLAEEARIDAAVENERNRG